ncbi:hypothetical protein [Enterobacter kobei]|uniref:hypothetical protein n=1 Tax=Enterobacter kobei TaxID=208224 RepID=UPI0021C86131|nr:hypothetical protein [Enterobacter kobei]MCU2431965.1 hypothetical protein [Enterobacter kobei]
MSNKLTPDQSSNALEFDLFQGDFGSPDDCELTNKIVISRGDYTCHICAGPIVKGEEHRSARYKFDGEIMGYRCCNTCCIAMASSVCCDYIGDEDDGDSDDVDPIDARYSLGDKRRNHREGDCENVAGSH